ncbi:hypothetical protein BU23DRAFT_575231 [Bimuria novae-zelandiae CBS 107.79]|uniref:Zn(2)-C6 fungal-type domain-containing protein n=1 Tax=Bimuria novae-zelandiae CBS 107.79 TaxID=1447943 RepID=A0A6A5UQ29_9PLEO|nr:hypothetical protein BU23DRAFT_575231 [Bimuria novae-zelandiae CBS 107.79]
MEFERAYGYAPHTNIGYPIQYQYSGPNTVLAVSNGARVNARVCPVRAPIGNARPPHMRGGREEDNESGQTRRRVAVACARCRKRKIRCSGDPGDGTGCQNCHSAGVDPKLCAFHRVGSGEASSMIDLHNLAQMASSNTLMLYNPPANPARSRPLTYPSGLDTKSIYPQSAWYTSPYNSEETSPMEAYGLDQSTTYLPNQSPITCSSSYGWSTDSKPAVNNYPGHDSLYRAHGLPYIQHNVRAAASSETLSNSMTSLQLTLPERPHTRSGLPLSQRPQLPIPQPSPAQTSRNVVDQLQDQRLRSARAMGGSSFSSGGFIKPLLPLHNDNDAQITATTEALAAQISTSTPISTSDSVACYSGTLSATTDEVPVSTAPQFNFSTSPLFDAMSAPAQPSYSNFRDSQDYSKPANSPSTNSTTPMTRQISQNNLYSIGTSSSSRSSLGGNGSTLVSGHRYTPLAQSPNRTQHQTTLKNASNQSMIPMCRTPTTISTGSF